MDQNDLLIVVPSSQNEAVTVFMQTSVLIVQLFSVAVVVSGRGRGYHGYAY